MMRLTKPLRFFFLACALGLGGCSAELKWEPSLMLQDAATFLWSQQGEDGGWHSETHGILQSGQAVTPFVLDALLSVPDSVFAPDPDRVRSALDFISGQTNAEGALGLADPDLLEYPNYATAFGLKCICRAGGAEDDALRDRMQAYLKGQQIDGGREFGPEHAAFGGWGFGERVLMAGNPGHVDLSHTRRVLEALQTCGALDPETKGQALIFLRRMQKHPDQEPADAGLLAQFVEPVYDGGFIYSPVQEDVNKGGWNSDTLASYMRSYATATADGLLALACIEEGGEAGKAAQDWLESHAQWSAPAGIPEDHPQDWHRVMFYYHLTVRAQAYRHWSGDPGFWISDLMGQLRGKQAENGSFSNPEGAPNKENDPLLATAMVVRALCAALEDA